MTGILNKNPKYSVNKDANTALEPERSAQGGPIRGDVVERSILPPKQQQQASLQKSSKVNRKANKSLAQLLRATDILHIDENRIGSGREDDLNVSSSTTTTTATTTRVSSSSLPSENNTDEERIEAEISFTCMSVDEYKERGKRNEVFNVDGCNENDDSVDDESDSKDEEIEAGEEENDEEDRESAEGDWNVNAYVLADDFEAVDEQSRAAAKKMSKMERMAHCLYGDMEEIEEQPCESEIKPFLVLWQAITSWATLSSASLIENWKHEKDYEQDSSVHDTSDVGFSRCTGLMAILKMNLPAAFRNIESSGRISVERKKKMEQRMGQ